MFSTRAAALPPLFSSFAPNKATQEGRPWDTGHYVAKTGAKNRAAFWYLHTAPTSHWPPKTVSSPFSAFQVQRWVPFCPSLWVDPKGWPQNSRRCKTCTLRTRNTTRVRGQASLPLRFQNTSNPMQPGWLPDGVRLYRSARNTCARPAPASIPDLHAFEFEIRP